MTPLHIDLESYLADSLRQLAEREQRSEGEIVREALAAYVQTQCPLSKGIGEHRGSGGLEDDMNRSAAESAHQRGHTPNLQALSILHEVHRRQQNRVGSDSSKTQEYLREARSGGMYGHDDGCDNE